MTLCSLIADRESPVQLWHRLATIVRRALLVCIAVVLGLLLIRRFTADWQPLDPFVLILVASAALTTAVLWRYWHPATLFHWVAVTCVLLCFLALLSLPGSSLLCLGWMWMSLLIVEGVQWFFFFTKRPVALSLPRKTQLPFATQPVADELPSQVTQQFIREQLDNSTEVCHGAARCDFMKDERTKNLHIAFCPPLEHSPQVTCEQAAGPPCIVKVGEAHTYGVRFDLRLTNQDRAAAQVVFRFVATATKPQSKNT